MGKYNMVHKDANKSYGMYKIGPKCHRVVKNLKDYTDEEEAIIDLMRLLDSEIAESDIIGSNFEQGVEAGKLGNRILCLESELGNIRSSLIQAMGDNDKLENAAREAVKRIGEILGEGGKEKG